MARQYITAYQLSSFFILCKNGYLANVRSIQLTVIYLEFGIGPDHYKELICTLAGQYKSACQPTSSTPSLSLVKWVPGYCPFYSIYTFHKIIWHGLKTEITIVSYGNSDAHFLLASMQYQISTMVLLIARLALGRRRARCMNTSRYINVRPRSTYSHCPNISITLIHYVSSFRLSLKTGWIIVVVACME